MKSHSRRKYNQIQILRQVNQNKYSEARSIIKVRLKGNLKILETILGFKK